MPKNQTLDEFYSTFREEVLCASDTETSGWTTEDFLTKALRPLSAGQHLLPEKKMNIPSLLAIVRQ